MSFQTLITLISLQNKWRH